MFSKMSHELLLMLVCNILFLTTAAIAALPRAHNFPESEHDAVLKPLSETPQNEAVTAGGTVLLRCTVVDPPPASRVLWAELTTATGGMAISDGENILPTHPNRDRYRIVHESSTEFHLEIRDVRLSDGGQYVCQDVQESASFRASAQLVVLASAPVCSSTVPSDGSVLEGQSHYGECVITYHGNIQPTMTWTGPPPFEVTHSPPDPARVWARVAITANRDMDEQYFECLTNFTSLGDQPADIATNIPAWENLFRSLIYVYWGPKDMYVDPEKETYAVGDVIRCAADAYPAASYGWQNLHTLDIFYGQLFVVTANMQGLVTQMRCQAQNIIQGFVYSQTIFIYVNVP